MYNHRCTHLFTQLCRQFTHQDTSQAMLFPPSLSLEECNHYLHPSHMGDGAAPAGCVPVFLHANPNARAGRSPVRPQTPTQGSLLPTPGCSSLGDTFCSGVTVEGGCLARFGQGAAVTH